MPSFKSSSLKGPRTNSVKASCGRGFSIGPSRFGFAGRWRHPLKGSFSKGGFGKVVEDGCKTQFPLGGRKIHRYFLVEISGSKAFFFGVVTGEKARSICYIFMLGRCRYYTTVYAKTCSFSGKNPQQDGLLRAK